VNFTIATETWYYNDKSDACSVCISVTRRCTPTRALPNTPRSCRQQSQQLSCRVIFITTCNDETYFDKRLRGGGSSAAMSLVHTSRFWRDQPPRHKTHAPDVSLSDLAFTVILDVHAAIFPPSKGAAFGGELLASAAVEEERSCQARRPRQRRPPHVAR
jgi:hypothetical protein